MAAGGLVGNGEGALLMIFRRDKWDLPKGKLDPGETLENCALREVQEETGLQELSLKGFAAMSTHAYFDTWINADVEKETHWYYMEAPADAQLVPQTEESITAIAWKKGQDLEDCLTNSYPNIVSLIRQYWINRF